MYPIAWAILEGENNDSWEWYFIELQKCLGLDEGNGVTFISNEYPVRFNHPFFICFTVTKSTWLI